MDVKRLHETFAEDQAFRRQFAELVERFDSLTELSNTNPNVTSHRVNDGAYLLSGFKFIGDTALRELGMHAPGDDFFEPRQQKLDKSNRFVGPVYSATVILSEDRDAAEVYTGIDAVFLSSDGTNLESGGDPVCEYYEYVQLPDSNHVGDLIAVPNGVHVAIDERYGYPLNTIDPQHVIKHSDLKTAIKSVHGALDIIESTPSDIPAL